VVGGTEDPVLVGDMVDLLGFDELILLHDLDAGISASILLFY
jgi:hypothetical protein